MNIKSLLLVFTLVPPSSVFAEAYDNNRATAATKLEGLATELQLTADQKSKLEAIFNERHEKIRAIREETQNRIKDILTDEQLEEWEASKKY
jgi:Spy/CpxP family protein refolding chaperone